MLLCASSLAVAAVPKRTYAPALSGGAYVSHYAVVRVPGARLIYNEVPVILVRKDAVLDVAEVMIELRADWTGFSVMAEHV